MKLSNLLYFLLIVFATTSLSSCGDDVADENKSRILGTWIASDRILQCPDEEPVTEALDCTDESCIRILFEVDTLKRQIYIKESTERGITESEFGTFSVGESSVSFCQEEDGEQLCYSSSLDISRTELQLSTAQEDSGCRELLIFYKESIQ